VFLNHITGILNKDTRLLDYGCGEEGILSSLIKKFKNNIDPYNYDPLVKKFSALPDGKFDVIMCIETMEHIRDVQQFFEDINTRLDKDGIVICSTKIYEPFGPNAHTKAWRYLTPEIGQHITFWSRKSLQHMAKAIQARCAIVKFKSKVALEFFVFCRGSSISFIDKTHYDTFIL
jgi:cyclopropane fatty-acyl-phospholipid synthase-like methyltransferase